MLSIPTSVDVDTQAHLGWLDEREAAESCVGPLVHSVLIAMVQGGKELLLARSRPTGSRVETGTMKEEVSVQVGRRLRDADPVPRQANRMDLWFLPTAIVCCGGLVRMVL